MAHTYFKSEPGLWTVGTHDGGHWESESDHDTAEKAAARVHYLNGGNPAHNLLVAALKDCVSVMERELNGLAVIQPELRQSRAALAAAGAQ